jgi:hypothetical protein
MGNVEMVVDGGRGGEGGGGIDETIQREGKGKETIKTREKSTRGREFTPPSHSPRTISRSLNNPNPLSIYSSAT